MEKKKEEEEVEEEVERESEARGCICPPPPATHPRIPTVTPRRGAEGSPPLVRRIGRKKYEKCCSTSPSSFKPRSLTSRLPDRRPTGNRRSHPPPRLCCQRRRRKRRRRRGPDPPPPPPASRGRRIPNTETPSRWHRKRNRKR